jgi:perosamine synthetase
MPRDARPKEVEPLRLPLSEPSIGGREAEYVRRCLDTGWVSSAGAFVDRFEADLAATFGRRHAVAVVNGTSALHLALLAVGVEPGEEVLVSALTFIAPANAVRYVGAHPVFMDADPSTWQMDPAKVADFLREECAVVDGVLVNRVSRRRVRALLPVHVLGHPVDLDPILDLARRFGLVVVEDAAEAVGARYKGRPAGGLADAGCVSFNGNKIVTTGGGGAVLTDDPEVAHRVRYLSTQAKDDPTEYVHGRVGFNFRLSNVLAAIGCAQLERLPEFLARKRHLARLYAEELGRVPGIRLMPSAPWAEPNFWLYTVMLEPETFGADRRKVREHLLRAGIETRPLWQPLHRSPAHHGAQAYRVEVADHVQARALSLPSSVGMDPAHVSSVVRALVAAAASPSRVS